MRPDGLDSVPGSSYQCEVRFPVNLVDISAAAVVAVVILLPARAPVVEAHYPDAIDTAKIGADQAELAQDPGDGRAVQDLVASLLEAGETDWALRVAGDAARHKDSPTLWRSYLAISWAHSERFDIKDAYDYAGKAMEACDRDGADCPDYERVRLMLYFNELQAGMDAVHAGIDPRADPRKFRDAINSSYPHTRFPHRKRLERGPAPGAEP